MNCNKLQCPLDLYRPMWKYPFAGDVYRNDRHRQLFSIRASFTRALSELSELVLLIALEYEGSIQSSLVIHEKETSGCVIP
jgi:hypothetical protein